MDSKSNNDGLFSVILKVFETIASIAGIVLYYCGHNILLYICAAIIIISILYELVRGELNSPITTIIAAFIGFVVASILALPKLPTVAVAICYETALMSIPVLIMGIMMIFRRFF